MPQTEMPQSVEFARFYLVYLDYEMRDFIWRLIPYIAINANVWKIRIVAADVFK